MDDTETQPTCDDILRVNCFDAYCPNGSVLQEIGTWVIGMGASKSDSMVGKGIDVETRIVLWS